jgi:hypothetical protein
VLSLSFITGTRQLLKNWYASFLGLQKHDASVEDDDELIAPVPLIHAAQFLIDD